MKQILVLCFLIIIVYVSAITITVKQDNTGDFASIQQAIIASTHGDTILVYPGNYPECLNLLGKQITLASLKLTTGLDSYIDETIIDGNYQSSVINMINGETNQTRIHGFTITHGIGSQSPDYSTTLILEGGGINCRNSSPSIEHCLIVDNIADIGGGLFLRFASATLISNIVKNNRAYQTAGGVYLSFTTVLDTTYKNSVFNNYAGIGCDIAIASNQQMSTIVLDTISVENPESYFIWPRQYFIVQAEHYKFNEVNADLYVAPNGDDNNDGLSVNTPLKSICKAMAMIKSDSINTKTIHLASGVYSPSFNNQYYPLNCKKSFRIKGENSESTILDAEGAHGIILSWNGIDRAYLSDLKIINTYISLWSNTTGPINFNKESNEIYINNIKMNNNNSWATAIMNIGNTRKIVIGNLDATNNRGTSGITLMDTGIDPSDVLIESSRITNNKYQIIDDELNGFCPIALTGNYFGNQNKFTIINTEISKNMDNGNDFPPSSLALDIIDRAKVKIINSTIVDNHTTGSQFCGGVNLFTGSTVSFLNSIIYGNTSFQVILGQDDMGNINTVNVKNSLIQPNYTGWEGHGICNLGNTNTVNWLENNIELSPHFLGSGDYPYQLQANSPCINTGTMEYPEGIEIPETDLAGNPRVHGSSIDMGAYECQDSVSVNDIVLIPKNSSMILYPNPFKLSNLLNEGKINIRINQVNNSYLKLDIFNIKGQKVKTLVNGYGDRGDKEFYWQANDDNNDPLPSGIYFCKLKMDKETLVRKITIIK